tara:strand:- start:28 stop:393 length:366 start_codon:yes stop_codon:yes gene_type:complete
MSWTLRNEFRLNLDGVDWDSQPVSTWDTNFTYNYTPMLNKAFALAGLTEKFEDHFHDLHGMNNIEAGPVILQVYVAMITYKLSIEELQPDNGWGTYEQLLDRVKDMLVRNTTCLNKNFVWC